MIDADELARMIKAESYLTDDPPVSTEAVEDAAGIALEVWGDSGPAPLTSAA